MARYTESVCRLCRRENLKMYLKGDRCYTDKCAIERRPYPPGQHGQGRIKFSEYGVQLREKQKVKRMYGLLESGFRHAFAGAAAAKGRTGENLLRGLELRLDNAVFRLGFADSRNEARQLVQHGHFRVNGRKVTIPSYQLRTGDVVDAGAHADHQLQPLPGAHVPGPGRGPDRLERAVQPELVAPQPHPDLAAQRRVDVPVRQLALLRR